MALVGLHDPVDIYMSRSDFARSVFEQTWWAYFDLVVGANRILNAQGDLQDVTFNTIAPTLDKHQKAMILASFAAALQEHGNYESAHQVFDETLRAAAWAGQAAVVRACIRCVGLLAAQEEEGKLLWRLNGFAEQRIESKHQVSPVARMPQARKRAPEQKK